MLIEIERCVLNVLTCVTRRMRRTGAMIIEIEGCVLTYIEGEEDRG